MKRILLIFVLGASILLLDKAIRHPVEAQMPTVSEEKCVSDTVTRTEWNAFVQALIYVESEGRPNAVGKTNDVGILQITPIYVREVNRILGEQRYTLEDRVDVDKSLEMFAIFQDHHNPDHDIDRAIHLHNPGAGSWYGDRIRAQMNVVRRIE